MRKTNGPIAWGPDTSENTSIPNTTKQDNSSTFSRSELGPSHVDDDPCRKADRCFVKAVAKCEMRLARMGRAYSSAGLDAYEVLLHQKVHAAASKAELRKLKEDLKEVRRVQRKYVGTKPVAAPQAK